MFCSIFLKWIFDSMILLGGLWLSLVVKRRKRRKILFKEDTMDKYLKLVISTLLTKAEKKLLLRAATLLNQSDIHDAYFVSLLDNSGLASMNILIKENMAKQQGGTTNV